MTASGEFIEIQGTAEHRPFNKAQMDKLLALAKKGIEDLIGLQRDSLKTVIGDA
jgi:ribonuclease PH